MSIRNGIRLIATHGLQSLLRLRARALLDELDPGPVLVVAPHPDDETLGCGRLIAALCARGIDVDVLWLTDGEASHAEYPGGPAALGATRRSEARAAAATLGVVPAGMHHLGAPDGKLPHLPAAQRDAVIAGIAGLVAALKPGTVLVTSALDGSTEHAAAHALVVEALRLAGHQARLRTYLVWAYWNVRSLSRVALRPSAPVYFAATPAATAARQRAVLAHHSQTSACTPQGEVMLSPHFLACFPHGGEFFLLN